MQKINTMRYEPIDKTFFIKNREKLTAQMKPGTMAILNANDVMPKSADGVYPYVQGTDFFYLSGIEQEESILLLFPDAKEEKYREVLFVRETNEELTIWEGAKYSKQEAAEVSGIESVFWTSAFEKTFRQLVFESESIYLNANEHSRAAVVVETRDLRFLKWCKTNCPLHKYERLAPIMHHLRATKSKVEISLIKEACRITGKAFFTALDFVRPGVWEFEIEAEMNRAFLINRSRGPAFETIVASGANSCILHYVKNNRQCRKGDVLLMDFGAEYANYAADVTRTIPVSGRFSPRQRAVYEAVLKVQKAAIQMICPGNTFDEFHKEVGREMEAALIDLGLLNARDIKSQDPEKPLYKKYFMHGASHHLGLDVHDLGNKYRKFEAGMVVTCEPGIYILAEDIGVRIENDILITKKGPLDLTQTIPVEPEEIEGLMNA